MKKKMPKAPNGPRSVFSLLPMELRFRLTGLIQDGATADSLAADNEICAAWEERGARFNRGTLTRIRKSKEYQELAQKRSEYLAAQKNDKIAAILSRDANEVSDIGDQARVKLMRALSDVSDLSDLSDSEQVKALRSLAQSLAALDVAPLKAQLADWKRKYLEEKELRLAAEQEWKAREAKLLFEIKTLKSGDKKSDAGISPEILAEVEGKIKLL